MTDWVATAKGTLRAEMRRRDLSYADLVAKLREAGVKESEANYGTRSAGAPSPLLSCCSVSR